MHSHRNPRDQAQPLAGQRIHIVLRVESSPPLPEHQEPLLAESIDLPDLPPETCTPHPVLACSETPRLIWDVRIAPARAFIISNNPLQRDEYNPTSSRPSPLRLVLWNESATTPQSESLTIRVDNCTDNVIIVFPKRTHSAFVRVLDVLTTIWEAPRCALGKPDCDCPRCVAKAYIDDTTSTSQPLLLDTGTMFPRRGYLHNDIRAKRRRRGGSLDGRWGWGGLTASTTERGVWNLLLR
ncbi:hypothetical protein DFP72DRAFT_224756 [Ephemerocybe angulata]|uniref:Uncharacterized protein n=1 Tax=Ephemerocybe angulata TaxID=980116 RepID=A0A8H6I2V0_9AGAR|nr:hypothetical protein DFP72DRAFT_224756 [Tulosesus angulatus]